MILRLCLFLLLPLAAFAAEEPIAPRKPVPMAALEAKIQDGIHRVEEFQQIREWAQANGVRVYLFGGTSASLAQYAKLDLAREQGDQRILPDRFGYRVDQIFLPNQDLDIVIDGPPEKAKALQAFVAERMPYLDGKKDRWEVTLLREPLGDKPAKLNNPDFSNQHTDSLSVGAIELTDPPAGEPRVRDVLHWDAPEAPFLREVAEGKIHYLQNPLHETTKFFREGRNPPILSAVRFLTKAFQFGLEVSPEDEAKVKAAVDAFKPKKLDEYSKNWMGKNAPKLFRNSVDLEYTHDVLARTGLKEKLKPLLKKDPASRLHFDLEPLATKPVGEGHGMTAAEFAAKYKQKSLSLAHDTASLAAYYSLTRSLDGRINALKSKDGAAGAGFYTSLANEGMWENGFTVRATLDPRAREGTDFVVSKLKNRAGVPHLVIQNKAALKLDVKSAFSIDPKIYFRYLMNKAEQAAVKKNGDEAVYQMFRDLLYRRALPEADYREIAELLAANPSRTSTYRRALRDWIALPRAKEFSPPIIKALEERGHVSSLADTFSRRPEYAAYFTKHPLRYQATRAAFSCGRGFAWIGGKLNTLNGTIGTMVAFQAGFGAWGIREFNFMPWENGKLRAVTEGKTCLAVAKGMGVGERKVVQDRIREVLQHRVETEDFKPPLEFECYLFFSPWSGLRHDERIAFAEQLLDRVDSPEDLEFFERIAQKADFSPRSLEDYARKKIKFTPAKDAAEAVRIGMRYLDHHTDILPETVDQFLSFAGRDPAFDPFAFNRLYLKLGRSLIPFVGRDGALSKVVAHPTYQKALAAARLEDVWPQQDWNLPEVYLLRAYPGVEAILNRKPRPEEIPIYYHLEAARDASRGTMMKSDFRNAGDLAALSRQEGSKSTYSRGALFLRDHGAEILAQKDPVATLRAAGYKIDRENAACDSLLGFAFTNLNATQALALLADREFCPGRFTIGYGANPTPPERFDAAAVEAQAQRNPEESARFRALHPSAEQWRQFQYEMALRSN